MAVNYSVDKYDLGIVRQDSTNVGMMLVQKSGVPQFGVYDDEYLASQFFTGVPGYASLPSEKELSVRQESWRAGFGLDIYDASEPERYYLSRGMDMRFRGMGIAGPRAVVANVPPITSLQMNDANFEAGAGWTDGTYTTVSPYEGTKCINVSNVAGTTDGFAYQTLPWNDEYKGRTFEVNVWTQHIGGAGTNYATIRIFDGVTHSSSSNTAAPNWTLISARKTLATNATELTIKLYITTTSSVTKYRFDYVTLTQPVNGVPTDFKDFNDNLYLAKGNVLCKLQSNGNGFDYVSSFVSNIPSLEPFTDNSLYIAQNTSKPYYAMNTSEGFTVSGAGVNTFQFFKTVHSSSPTLWGNDGNATIRSNLTPSNALAWSGQTAVGSNYHTITDLITKSGALYIMKEDMPYYLDSTGAVKNDLAPKLQALISATSGKNSYTDGEKIYVPCGTQALLEIDGTALTWRSPAEFCTNLPMYNGRVQALAADDQWLFAAINYGSGTIEILAGRLETIGNSVQWVWHSIAELTMSGVEKMYVSSVYQKRLWIASTVSTEPLYYIPLPSGYGDITSDANRSFQTNTWFETPWLHAEFRDTVKAFPKLTVLLGHTYNSNVYFESYYKKLEDTSWTYVGDLKGATNTMATSLYIPVDATNTVPESTMLRLRFVAKTSYTDKTPILLGYNLQGLLYPPRRSIIACTVRCADEVVLKDGTIDHGSKETIEDTIEEMLSAQWPVTIYDLEGNQKYVKPLPLSSSVPKWVGLVNEKTKKTEKHYNLLLQEVTLSGSGVDTPHINVGGIPVVRTATYVVAASNAPAHVKAQADYVCDGVDDQVEIQTAIDALDVSLPGIVHLSSGYFYLSNTINLNKNSMTMEGEGNTSILYLTNTINKDIVNISQGWVVLRDIRVEGNKANNLISGSGVVFTNGAALCTIERVWSVDNREYGFKCTNAGEPTWLNYANRFLWCRATQNGSHGWYLYGLGSHKLIGCESGQNTGDGYNIYTTETSLVDCNADSNSGYGFIFISGGYHTLSGFRSTSNGKNGVCLQSDGYNTISNGVLYNNGQLSYSYAEFLIASSNWNTITGLTIHTNTDVLGGVSAYSFSISSATSGYSNIIKACIMKNDRTAGGFSNGIILDDGSGGTVINNIFEGNQVLATTPIVLLGTSTIATNKFKNNVGLITENSGTVIVLGTDTGVNVAHGLATIPTRVQITPVSNVLGSLYWNGVKATTVFTINMAPSPASNVSFDWRAWVGEG